MGGFTSGVDDSDDIIYESVGSSASPGVGRSVYSLDERLGLRKVATRTSVAVVCNIWVSLSSGGLVGRFLLGAQSMESAPHVFCAVSRRKTFCPLSEQQVAGMMLSMVALRLCSVFFFGLSSGDIRASCICGACRARQRNVVAELKRIGVTTATGRFS